MYIGVVRGGDEALRVLCFSEVEALMNARDHHVQFGKHLVGQIEFAVAENIHLDPSQQPEVVAFLRE